MKKRKAHILLIVGLIITCMFLNVNPVHAASASLNKNSVVLRNAKIEVDSINNKNIKLIKRQSYQIKINNDSKTVKWSSNNEKVASVSSGGKVKVKKKGTAVITGRTERKKYTFKVTGYDFLSKKQAEKAVANYCTKQQTPFRHILAEKSDGKYIVWTRYSQTDMMSKFVVETKTGKVVSYGPYFGVDEPATDNPKAEDRFNALYYL